MYYFEGALSGLMPTNSATQYQKLANGIPSNYFEIPDLLVPVLLHTDEFAGTNCAESNPLGGKFGVDIYKRQPEDQQSAAQGIQSPNAVYPGPGHTRPFFRERTP